VHGGLVDQVPDAVPALPQDGERPVVVFGVGGRQLSRTGAPDDGDALLSPGPARRDDDVAGPEGQGGPVNADLAGVEPVALPRLPLAEDVARRRRLETIDVHVLDTGRH